MPRIAPEMLARLRDEHAAVVEIRKLYPQVPQKKLARQIREHTFPHIDQRLSELLKRIGYRTLLSIYSIIRRVDAKPAAETAVV